jgi:hypothetical protein
MRKLDVVLEPHRHKGAALDFRGALESGHLKKRPGAISTHF